MNHRVFDCFTFYNERELLALRFEWLKNVVDFFVVVEGARTFTGEARNPVFKVEEYEIDPQKVRYILVQDLLGPGCDAWENERRQRNSILEGLYDLKDSDLVHVSDVDEVPNHNAFTEYKPYCVSAHLDQKMYYFQCNNVVVNRNSKSPIRCTGSKITTGRFLRSYWGTPDNLRRKVLQSRTLWNRLLFRLTHRVIGNAGWHWSFMMHPEKISEKIKAFSHTEFSGHEFSALEAVERRVAAGVDPFDREYDLRAEDLESEFPPKVVELIRRYCSMYIR